MVVGSWAVGGMGGSGAFGLGGERRIYHYCSGVHSSGPIASTHYAASAQRCVGRSATRQKPQDLSSPASTTSAVRGRTLLQSTVRRAPRRRSSCMGVIRFGGRSVAMAQPHRGSAVLHMRWGSSASTLQLAVGRARASSAAEARRIQLSTAVVRRRQPDDEYPARRGTSV